MRVEVKYLLFEGLYFSGSGGRESTTLGELEDISGNESGEEVGKLVSLSMDGAIEWSIIG